MHDGTLTWKGKSKNVGMLWFMIDLSPFDILLNSQPCPSHLEPPYCAQEWVNLSCNIVLDKNTSLQIYFPASCLEDRSRR